MADKIYFHVNKKPSNPPPNSPDFKFMKEGQLINFRDDDNFFTYQLKNDIPIDFFGSNSFPERPSFDSFLNLLLAGDYNGRKGFSQLLHKPLALYMKLVGELVLESIRLKEFKARPSRQRCLWLTETKDQAEVWASDCASGADYRIVKVCVKGNVFKCDSSLLEFTNESLFQMEERVRLYWRGEDGPFKREEILFEGNATVIEVLSKD